MTSLPLISDCLINHKETENGPGFINFRSSGVGEKFDFDDCIGIGLFTAILGD